MKQPANLCERAAGLAIRPSIRTAPFGVSGCRIANSLQDVKGSLKKTPYSTGVASRPAPTISRRWSAVSVSPGCTPRRYTRTDIHHGNRESNETAETTEGL